MNIKKVCGNNLSKIRKARGWTQEQFSELIDIHTRQLSKIENGEHFPSSKTLEKVCKALNIEVASLFKTKASNVKKEENFDIKYQKEINKILKLKEASLDKFYSEYIKLALSALKDAEELKKLDALVLKLNYKEV